jgi:gliding-associated putative ABC transporter substrate-binding component GldG
MKKEGKNKKIYLVIAFFAALLLINFLASQFNQRFDLTKENRYSLSRPTKLLLADLPEPIRIDVLMKGEYPAGFRRLASSVEQFLQESKEYGKGNFQFRFIDPFAIANDSAQSYLQRHRNEIDPRVSDKQIIEGFIQNFIDSISYYYDIPAYTLQAPGKVGDEQIKKSVLPGAIIYYRDTSVGVNLLRGARAMGTEPEQLAALYNVVEASMEYKFASAIQKLTTEEKPVVAYALGHGEEWGYNVDDAVRTLYKQYRLDTTNIRDVKVIPPYDALVIIKPTQRFSDADKFKIDQYVMNGGKIFWLVDNIYAEFDSLYKSQGFVAFDRALNLEDLLFNYGARLNQALLQDMQNDKLPQVSREGTQQRLVDWPFFPILNGTDHPISKNLDGVRALFPSTLDTVGASGIKKTFLLQSSRNARVLEAPVKIDFEFTQIAPDIRSFNNHHVPVAVLLEGKFRSLYTGRVSRAVVDSLAAQNAIFESISPENKMIVVSDGDIALNQFSQSSGPLPMGVNMFTRVSYANKDFFLNCIEYLVNPTEILQTRSKEYALRLLDPKRVDEEKLKWQLINILLPIAIIILIGFIYQSFRKRKYVTSQ